MRTRRLTHHRRLRGQGHQVRPHPPRYAQGPGTTGTTGTARVRPGRLVPTTHGPFRASCAHRRLAAVDIHHVIFRGVVRPCRRPLAAGRAREAPLGLCALRTPPQRQLCLGCLPLEKEEYLGPVPVKIRLRQLPLPAAVGNATAGAAATAATTAATAATATAATVATAAAQLQVVDGRAAAVVRPQHVRALAHKARHHAHVPVQRRDHQRRAAVGRARQVDVRAQQQRLGDAVEVAVGVRHVEGRAQPPLRRPEDTCGLAR